MIAHALTIIQKELEAHLKEHYQTNDGIVLLDNMAQGVEGSGGGTVKEGHIILMLVNIREEKTLKNIPNYTRNDISLKAVYQNPPVFLNFLVLVTATHVKYNHALLYISRAIRFFQSRNVFTQDDVHPDSLLDDFNKDNDRLEAFKLILDLYSPTMEEVNHLWGTLGGKQYPFVLYHLRMLDLEFKAVQHESGLITEVQSDFYHKNPVGN